MAKRLRVIGAGFGRTGTDSMRLALEQLGFGTCHHMRELIQNPDHKRDWRSAESWWTSFKATILPRLLADTDTDTNADTEETAQGSRFLIRAGRAQDA